MQPDPSPYDALLLVSFGGPEKPEDVVPFLENVTRGRGIPRERLEEVGEHYFQFGGRSPINDQNRAFLAALREDLAGAGHRPAGLLGQPQLGPLPHRHGGADGRRRDHPGRLLRDQRLLVVLQLPAVPREPLRRRRGRRERPAPGQAAALLQPPRLRGAGGRRHAGRAGRAAGRGARRGPPRVRHPLDPAVDERGQRARRRRVRRAAPQRRHRGRRAGPAGDRPPARARARLLLAVRGRRTSPGSSPTSTTTSSASATGAPARS